MFIIFMCYCCYIAIACSYCRCCCCCTCCCCCCWQSCPLVGEGDGAGVECVSSAGGKSTGRKVIAAADRGGDGHASLVPSMMYVLDETAGMSSVAATATSGGPPTSDGFCGASVLGNDCSVLFFLALSLVARATSSLSSPSHRSGKLSNSVSERCLRHRLQIILAIIQPIVRPRTRILRSSVRKYIFAFCGASVLGNDRSVFSFVAVLLVAR